MALSKSIETEGGVNATYWRIANRYNSVSVAGYLNQRTRREDGESLDMANIHLPVEIRDEIKTIIYNYLKTTPEFEGAEDC